jgi:ankyrin repeat protein
MRIKMDGDDHSRRRFADSARIASVPLNSSQQGGHAMANAVSSSTASNPYLPSSSGQWLSKPPTTCFVLPSLHEGMSASSDAGGTGGTAQASARVTINPRLSASEANVEAHASEETSDDELVTKINTLALQLIDIAKRAAQLEYQPPELDFKGIDVDLLLAKVPIGSSSNMGSCLSRENYLLLVNGFVLAGGTKYLNPKQRNARLAELIGLSEKESDIDFKGVSRMLQDGADVNGAKHLLRAVSCGKENLVKLLAAWGAQPDTADEKGNTPLMLAADKPGIMQTLLNLEPKLDLINKEGETALMIAVQRGSAECVSMLVKAGANTKVKDRLHSGLLILAVMSGDRTTIETVLKARVKIDQRDYAKRTALFYAVRKDLHEVIPLLVRHGANINKRDADGATPLIVACQSQKAKVAASLIANGADPGIRDKHSRNALDYVCSSKRQEFERILKGQH